MSDGKVLRQHTCEVCGSPVEIVQTREGTTYYRSRLQAVEHEFLTRAPRAFIPHRKAMWEDWQVRHAPLPTKVTNAISRGLTRLPGDDPDAWTDEDLLRLRGFGPTILRLFRAAQQQERSPDGA